MNSANELISRYQDVRSKIDQAAKQASRSAEEVTLIAVSKTHPYESIRTLYEFGHRDFGENYVQELIEKATRAKADRLTEIRWHFIGHLQTNKVKLLVPHSALIHGVGSLRLAEEIEKRSENRKIPVLIEVNIDGQESKSGIQISELRPLVESLSHLPHVVLKGLMCIPDPIRPEGSRAAFRRISALGADLGLTTFSMGMTADFSEAIAEGATLVRIGTAIFGERSPLEKV